MSTVLEPIVWILVQAVNIYIILVMAEIILHWLLHFKIVSPTNAYVAKAVELLTKVTKPAYDKIREKVPAVSGFDFSPFILLVVAMFVWRVLYRLDVALM